MTPESELKQFQIHEEIGRGAFSIVYRATLAEKTYALKLPQHLAHEDAQSVRMKLAREAASLAMLHDPGLVELYHVGGGTQSPFLAMEYVDGPSLAQVLATRGRLDEKLLLTYAKTLVSALIQVHGRGLIHCDIKPQNILINSQGIAKLIDFGFVRRQQAVFDQSKLSEKLTGTFLYTSPEQTGLLKRPIDGRTDLYAIGVVLFECLTGSPPFHHDNVGELLRMHAVTPAPDLKLVADNVSPGLAAIVAKLLAKDPDDRYQTAKGLLKDLETVDQWSDQTKLGAGDRLNLTTNEIALIGRDDELNKLTMLLKEAYTQKGAVVLVEGAAGNGKSRLVRELCQRARQEGALVMVGKCSLSEHSPYVLVRALVEGHLQSLETMPAEKQQEHRTKVVAAATEFAPVLRRFSPLFAGLFPTVKDYPERLLNPELFCRAIVDFIEKLSNQYSSIVLLADDVQWLDSSSMQCLQLLSQEIATFPVVLACTARNDEQNAIAIDKFRAAIGESHCTRLMLAPISQSFLGNLVEAHLGHRPVDPTVISTITKISAGNPFAVGEYLRVILDNGFLYPTWDGWHLDTQGIESLHLPTDVLDLVIQRMTKLSGKVMEILQYAATIGSRFSVPFVAMVGRFEDAELHQALGEALAANLIEQTENENDIQFVHDRVQEACLQHISPEDSKNIHQRAAEVLAAGYATQGSAFPARKIFELAKHAFLCHTERDPHFVYETQLNAARHAIKEASYQAAHQLLKNAANFSSGESDPVYEEMTGDVSVRMSLLGQANSHYETALKTITDSVHRARIYHKRSDVCRYLYDFIGAQVECAEAYRELGHKPVRCNLRFIASSLGLWLLGTIFGTKLSVGRSLGARQKESLEVVCELPLAISLYSNLHVIEAQLLIFRTSYYAHRLGPSPHLAAFYAAYGASLAGMKLHKKSQVYFRKSLAMAKSFDDTFFISRCYFYAAVGTSMSGMYRESKMMLLELMERYARWAHYPDYLTCSSIMMGNLDYVGDISGIKSMLLTISAQSKYLANDTKSQHWGTSAVYHVLVLIYSGQFSAAQAELERQRATIKKGPLDNSANMCLLLKVEFQFLCEQEEFGPIFEEKVREFNAYRVSPVITPHNFKGPYLGIAYARHAQYNALSKDKDKQQQILPMVLQAVANLKKAASVPVLQSHARVLEAFVARISGAPHKAKNILLEAEELAHRCDNHRAHYEIALERARLYQETGNGAGAIFEATIAYNLANREAWVSRARRVKRDFDLPLTSVESSQWMSGSSSTSSVQVINQQRAFDALLRVSFASAEILDHERQAHNVLDELIKILGAERGFLFLLDAHQQNLLIKAGRNSQGQVLEELTGYSTTVVERVRETCNPFIVTGTDEGNAIGSESVVVHNLRSIMAAPIKMGGKMMGVLYVDSRVVKGLFSVEDLNLFQAMANQIAVSLETARIAQTELEKQALEKEKAVAEERIKAAHEAGMAEIATDIIHTIGNLMNLLELTIDRMVNRVKDSSVSLLTGSSHLLQENRSRLSEFVSSLSEDLARLKQSSEHIRGAVNLQKVYTKVGLHREPVAITDFINEVLQVARGSLDKSHVRVTTSFTEVPTVVHIQKHKLFKVLMALIKNANEAMAEIPETNRFLTIQTEAKANEVVIVMTDSGCGITPENLDKIFNQGFSSKKDGHGFGLHMAANAMTEIGGTLAAASAGVGCGAQFTLTLPLSS